jgi:hypothetical protein
MVILGDGFMKYCRSCGQNVQPTKKFSIAWFLINCIWLVGGIVYIIYFLFFKKKTCPICNGNNFEHEHKAGEADNIAEAPSSKEVWGDKLEKQKANRLIAEAELQKSKETLAETMRKRKAGELPWQIKKAQRKEAKLNKVN